MTSLSVNRKGEKLSHPMRPWFLGIPAFLVALMFLLWLVAHLASWVFVVLRVNK